MRGIDTCKLLVSVRHSSTLSCHKLQVLEGPGQNVLKSPHYSDDAQAWKQEVERTEVC